MKFFPFYHFPFEKGLIIVLNGFHDHGMLRLEGLNQNFTGFFTSARPTGYLGHQLISSFPCSQIRKASHLNVYISGALRRTE